MPFNRLFSKIIRRRMVEINNTLDHPVQSQDTVFNTLITNLPQTQFGLDHGFSPLEATPSLSEFKKKIPLRSYDDIKPWIIKSQAGESDVLWPGKTQWFAKSSGTSSDRSKYLPVTKEALKTGHYKGGRDLLAMFCEQVPHAPLYGGKHLIIGGSSKLHSDVSGSYSGDLSAIIIRNLPPWVEMRRTPGRKITMLDDWEKKVELMAEKVVKEDVRILAGIPSWMLIVTKRVLEISGAKTLDEVWPNLWLYMHGGVGFAPYKAEFDRLIKSENMHYIQTYNASEGFFAIQDDLQRDDMALLLSHGIYYEFIPLAELNSEKPRTLTAEQLELNGEYELVISTNAGLWRYKLGDIIRITCTAPLRIVIMGRTSSFLNVVGEELMIAQTELALSRAFRASPHHLKDFIVAPRFDIDSGNPIGHEWVIECATIPSSLIAEDLAIKIDHELRSVNSDYDAKRSGSMILSMPIINFVPPGTFEKWLSSHNKLGGQHKIPRLSNSRQMLDELLVITNR
jgi:hypothetical protein